MAGVDDDGRRLDGGRGLARVLPTRRWAQVVSGLTVAVVAAIVFTALFWGLHDWLIDRGRLGLPILLAARVACFATIGWGCWRAYQGFRRP
ncbi:hypothetical protein [Micromonospora hortensis]|uniref:hypothetical protein n=1 Tax=Micromonospora hortensis TaxID=2911209 RepID=UPI001EE912DB|nr:hypothetical protein [Micromonospora hortensis]MCG5451643.1 hypothetical protein [Micromonospora hortensis]